MSNTELIIKKLPKNHKNPSENDNEIIRRALIAYQIVLGQYEKSIEKLRQKRMEENAKKNETNSLDAINPFKVDMTNDNFHEPTLEEIKEFVYSSWANAVANVQAPFPCPTAKWKGIRKKAFKDVKNGKFLTKKVTDVMQEYIDKLM